MDVRAGRTGIGVWSGVTRCISEQNHIELSWSEAPWGSHGVPLGSWSSAGPAIGSQLRWGLESLSRHSQTGGAWAAPSAWQGPVN